MTVLDTLEPELEKIVISMRVLGVKPALFLQEQPTGGISSGPGLQVQWDPAGLYFSQAPSAEAGSLSSSAWAVHRK